MSDNPTCDGCGQQITGQAYQVYDEQFNIVQYNCEICTFDPPQDDEKEPLTIGPLMELNTIQIRIHRTKSFIIEWLKAERRKAKKNLEEIEVTIQAIHQHL